MLELIKRDGEHDFRSQLRDGVTAVAMLPLQQLLHAAGRCIVGQVQANTCGVRRDKVT